MIEIPAIGDILTVDDNAADRRLVEIVVQRSHLNNNVVAFESGAAVLTELEQVLAGRRAMPALILVDVNMPGMMGFEVLSRIRAIPAFDVLPVVCMLSSSDALADRDAALVGGADAFIGKASGLDAYVGLINETFAPAQGGLPEETRDPR